MDTVISKNIHILKKAESNLYTIEHRKPSFDLLNPLLIKEVEHLKKKVSKGYRPLSAY